MQLEKNVSLKPFNTFGIEASASHFCSVKDVDDLLEALTYGKENSLAHFVLGGGSNILLTKNLDALTLKIDLKGIEMLGDDSESYLVKFQAGESWHESVMHCIQNGYAGIENLSLIPGNVGAAPMQNIGAYGVEIKQRFHELEALNIETLEIERFDLNACAFGYRESVFKRALKGQYIILNVTLRLLKTPEFNTSYGAIEQELERMDVQEPSLQSVSQAVINIRQSKLPDPKVIGNSGSFFKNPVVSSEQHEELKKTHPNIPAYPAPNGVKLAAGWLIEQAGWKGKRINDHGVHDKQALVLVNHGNAKGQDVFDLSEEILQDVHEKFGVLLEREVNVI